MPKCDKEVALLEFVKQHTCVPISNITIKEEWINSPYRFKTRHWEIFQGVSNLFFIGFISLKFQDIPNYINVDNCRYGAITEDIWEKYYSPEESEEILQKLLMFQFGDNINKFKKGLLNIIDKKIPKRNCMQIIGPPCYGKNYFLDCLADACINTGYIGNFYKYSNFPL